MTTKELSNKTAEEGIAASVIPYRRDDHRAQYLIYSACGLSIREALKMTGVAKSTLSLWRQDEEFVTLESRIPEFRKTLGLEFISIEFLRNYAFVLEKDRRVIKESLYPQKGDDGMVIPMSTQDHNYLIKMRSHYTPQQYQILEALTMAEGKGSNGINFTEYIIEASREVQRIRIEGRRETNEDLSSLQKSDA